MAVTKAWADFQAQLTLELKADAARLTAADLDEFLKRAAEIYAKDRPRTVLADIAATGAFEYAVPSDWDNDESVALQVEFPADKQDPKVIPEGEWTLYRSATGTYKLRFLETSPSSGTIRLVYTIPHVLNATTNTIPDSAFMAAIYKAAQLACEGLSAQYAKTSDPAINADVVNYRSKSQEFTDRAKEFERMYIERVKGDEAAGATGEWDLAMAGGGAQQFHKPKWR